MAHWTPGPYETLEYDRADSARRPTGLTVIVPCFNERQAIESTLDLLADTLRDAELPWEIIVVDDGSTDGSGELLRNRSEIRLLRHRVNRGYGASLKSGIRHARHELVAIVDADGTYPINRLPEFITLAEHADMIVGARVGSAAKHPTLRRLPKWVLNHFAQWMTRQPIPDLNSGMRVFRKSVVERFLNILPDGFSFTTTITLAMLTNNYVVHYEPIAYHPRVGRSKIRPIRDTLRFVQLILRTGMYFAPLRVFLPVATVFFLGFLVTLSLDVYHGNLNERTLLLLVAATQLGMFALLADMIDKRSG